MIRVYVYVLCECKNRVNIDITENLKKNELEGRQNEPK